MNTLDKAEVTVSIRYIERFSKIKRIYAITKSCFTSKRISEHFFIRHKS